MYRGENRKVLFVVGVGQEIEDDFFTPCYPLPQENIHILESDELEEIEPFGDTLRDILIHVYQKNINEIVIIHSKEDSEDIFGKMGNSINYEENNATLDYLFTHYHPEFPNSTLGDWLKGNNRLKDSRQTAAERIRRHPLVPQNVKITELPISLKPEKQLKK
ncbi:carbonic anhydrase [Bacillus tuaregi]|uniref:hypothetical protein n=1 Tax=Bacillus tuaregi TaxID=1816695 RepID=UPI0008F808A2|nr:hypothetical protein [Bacillus tuaregi]